MKRTFADEAKSIINKYSKREEDKWANKSKELELKLLMQKQEATGMTNSADKKLANGGWIFDAMQFAPIAYNAIQGLTPEQKLKSGDYMVNDQVTPYDVSFAPQEQAMLSSTRALNKDILSTGNKSAGDIIRNLRGSQTQYRQGISGLANQEQMLEGQLKMSADQFNIGNKQQNAARRFTVDDWNARSKAAKQNMLGTATSQLAQYGQGKRSDMTGMNLINSILGGEYTMDINGNLIRKKKKQSLDEEILNDNFTVDGK